MDTKSEVTQLLSRLESGDPDSSERLYELVYGELHRIARAHMSQQGAEHTLQPTALVHEAWMRIGPADEARWDGRTHFLSVASRAMRCALIDHARKRKADKRGGESERVAFDVVVEQHEARAMDLLTLDDALERLAELDERQAKIVELRFFGGLSMEDAAKVLGISLSGAERAMRAARAWLLSELEPG